MEKVSGLVLEVGENECTILAQGNKYLRLSTPDLIPAIGDIVEGYPVNTIRSLSNRRVSRIWAYVASILITVVLSGYQVYAVTSAPSAYVSLDMAPSVELVLNRGGKVIKTKGNNPEGSDLLQKVSQKVSIDTLSVNEALISLVKEAAHQSSSDSSNDVAILTFTDSSYLNRDELNALMSKTLEQEQFKGELIIDQVDTNFRNKATLANISPGQQLLMDLAAVDNVNISANDLRKTSLSALLKEHNIKLKALIDSLKDYTNDFPGLSFSQISTSLESTSNISSLLPILYPNHEPVTTLTPVTVAQVSAETNPVASGGSINPTPNVSIISTNPSQTQSIVSENNDPLVKQTSKQEIPGALQSNKNDKDTNLDKATANNKTSDATESTSKADSKKDKSEKQEHSKKANKDKEHKSVIGL
ncbi:MAG TPA: hypothetical protein VFF14_04575 [Candidatus Deferrimicrobium sp.]|nr:hypothetical protein [Candidatus Deferrimicrobium sp.]